ncbi:MAG: O-antigen ligase family protein [Candidatus Omnitrophica bacterium]|nr:O-antigen ligase family protein [Candidatus Omnitrophota bacterium]
MSLKAIGHIKYPLLLFTTSIFICLIFSQDRITSAKEIYKYIGGIILLVFTASLPTSEKNRVISYLVNVGLIISLLAIYQYTFGFSHLVNYTGKKEITDLFTLDYISRRRPFLPFVTPNLLGGYLAMIIPLGLIYKKKIWIVIPIAVALVLTASLGALLSLLVGLILYFYLKGGLNQKSIVPIFVILAIISLVFIFRSSAQKYHTQPIFSTLMRLNYWQDSLKIIKKYPLIGVGLGNFNLANSRYAHNSYLQLWAEMGVLGIIAFLWLVVAILKYNLERLKNHNRTTYIPLITSVVIFLVHNLIDFSFFLAEISFVWWVVMGLGLEDSYKDA